MLQAIDDLSSISFLEQDSSLSSWIRSFSMNSREVTVLKTEGIHHLVKFSNKETPATITFLKVVLYFTGILPLITSIMDVVIPRDDKGHRYFYDNPDSKHSLFIDAVKNKDITTMKALHTFNRNLINDKDENESPALIAACDKGDLDVISWLLNHHVDISATNKYGQTAFLYACCHGNLEIAKFLYNFSNGSVLQDRDNSESTPFITACLREDSSNLEIITWLYELTNGAILEDRDILGETGFMKICSQNLSEQLEVAEWLYQKSNGAVLTDRDFEGNTPFMSTLYERDFATANWLLEKSNGTSLQDKDRHGKTAFLRSCEEGFLTVAKWLYEKSNGSVLNDTDPDGRTATMLAQKSDFLNIRQWLSELSPDSGISEKITFNPILSSHLPKKLYEFCKSHRLFRNHPQTEATPNSNSTTLCFKEKKDLLRPSKLWIYVDSPKNASSPNKEEVLYFNYFPSNEKKYGFEKISFKFNEHHLLEVCILQNGLLYEKPCFSWNDQQDYIELIQLEILPQFIQ